jgi:tRNA 2-thiouridine synthesizing protein A
MDSIRSGIDEELDPEDQIKIEALLCDLERLRQNQCADCGNSICGHEALMSVTMGYKDAPKCWACLDNVLGYGKEALRDQIFAYIKQRTCHYEGWRWANCEEGFEPDALPGCLWRTGAADSTGVEWNPPSQYALPVSEAYDCEWDAGNMGCGDLVLELRNRIGDLKPGQILKLRATDSGAQEDLPAWCRMTGNPLMSFQYPIYLIRRK